VPYLLRDDGVGMEGSAVICAYLDPLNGKPTFATAAGEEAWELRRLEALARSLVDGLTVWGRELRHRPEEERSPRIIEHERQRSRRLTDQWEREVVNAQMCGGPNMAQRVLACGLQYGSYVLGLDWHGAYPNLARWLDEIAQRPSLAATAPSSGR
jgi:glutathione S-transferase